MEQWKTGDFSQSVVPAELVPSSSLQPQPQSLAVSSTRHLSNQLTESRFVLGCGFSLASGLYAVESGIECFGWMVLWVELTVCFHILYCAILVVDLPREYGMKIGFFN